MCAGSHNLLLGEGSAERIKRELGAACPPEDGDGETVHIKGRDLMNGVPKEIVLSERQISESLAEPVGAIIDAVKAGLESSAPELAADIVRQGHRDDGRGLATREPGPGAGATRRGCLSPSRIGPCTASHSATGRCLEEMKALKHALHEAY